ncbi:DUF3280 domain-containing protein [Rhizobium halophytocola]|uniref:DUF2380 domain-containing protein n=1 Tax=Rhizobium halophytocola TaxID=735519 RepID=A0ABS4DT70_9HYPH|nr:DUF3280 domain-containing protein [Rhizobium halophytocola]MBP1848809.1 hypothetical protein [Rhizobium halophytocola]
MRIFLTACALALLAMPAAPVLAAADLNAPLAWDAKVAFFGFHFIDTSTEGAYNGARADEEGRRQLLEARLRKALADRGFDLVPLAPVQTTLNAITNPAKCNGCDVDMARELDADYALVGEIQKVSNLILSMNLVMRDAETGRAVRALAVDIRGNTDESWTRGLDYLLKHGVFKE